MQVAIHLGAHATASGALLKSLFRNKGILAAEGVSLPGPGRYRRILLDLLRRLEEAPESPADSETLIDTISDEPGARRLILSHENFICPPAQILEDRILYAPLSERIMGLERLFKGAEIEFFLALRNPADLLPALLARMPEIGASGLLRGTDPLDISWLDVARRIREAAPEAGLTLWRDEDSPLIWEPLMRALCGLGQGIALRGTDDPLHERLTRHGLRQLRAYLAARPALTDHARARVIAAFLDGHARPPPGEDDPPAIPGWDERLIWQLTEIYEAECDEIAEMEGVRFLAP